MTIGERVLELIRMRKMTQKEFSQRTGIPQSTISDWKAKRLNPGSDKLMIICDVLEVDPVYLLSGTENAKYEKPDSVAVFKNSPEFELIIEYRQLNSLSKQRLKGYLDALKEQQESDGH